MLKATTILCALAFAARPLSAGACPALVGPACNQGAGATCTQTAGGVVVCNLDVAALGTASVADASAVVGRYGATASWRVTGVDSQGEDYCCDGSDWGGATVTAVQINGVDDNDHWDDIYFYSGVNANMIVYGKAGDDRIIDDSNTTTVSAWISGGPGNDELQGGAGPDQIQGDENDDLIYGGRGNDTLYAGAPYDVVSGGVDNWMFGGLGIDVMYGTQNIGGHDYMNGGPSEGGTDDGDYMYARAGDDIMCGDNGNDTMSGGNGDDLIGGWWGTDSINGDGGDDYCETGTCEHTGTYGSLTCPSFPWPFPHAH